MIHILSLPEFVLENILRNLRYDEIATNRRVCKLFNRLCMKLLNRGFVLVEKYHGKCLKSVKMQLPRRESERRTHPLARHCDILTAIETRLSMLSMTFNKYIDVGLCCFIPGKVLDEIFQVLRNVSNVKNTICPPRAHEVLQELRDISSMAMEHFDDKIVPELKYKLAQETVAAISSLTPAPSTSRSYHYEKFRLHCKKIDIFMKSNKTVMKVLKRKVGHLSRKVKRQNRQLLLCNAKLRKQVTKISEQEMQLADMKRHLEDWDHKFVELNTEFSRSRDGAVIVASIACSPGTSFQEDNALPSLDDVDKAQIDKLDALTQPSSPRPKSKKHKLNECDSPENVDDNKRKCLDVDNV